MKLLMRLMTPEQVDEINWWARAYHGITTPPLPLDQLGKVEGGLMLAMIEMQQGFDQHGDIVIVHTLKYVAAP